MREGEERSHWQHIRRITSGAEGGHAGMSTSQYRRAEHQAAGHGDALVDRTGALFVKPTVQQELDFYTQVQGSRLGVAGEEDGQELTLRDWMPVFMGTLEHGISETVEKSQRVTDEMRRLHIEQESRETVDVSRKYIVLQNLLHGFREPSIVDIKLGSVLYDESSGEEKRNRLVGVSKNTTSGSLHYRVCGMKLYTDTMPDLTLFSNTDGHVTKDEEGYLVFDKWYGRALTQENVIENFRIFFTHNKLSKEQQQIVLRNMFTRLQLLFNCLLSEEVRIRSGSILFAYESDPDRWKEMNDEDPILRDDLAYDDGEEEEEDHDEHALAPLSLLSMIDFAHAKLTPGKGHDEDVVIGVENLINALEKLIE